MVGNKSALGSINEEKDFVLIFSIQSIVGICILYCENQKPTKLSVLNLVLLSSSNSQNPLALDVY